MPPLPRPNHSEAAVLKNGGHPTGPNWGDLEQVDSGRNRWPTNGEIWNMIIAEEECRVFVVVAVSIVEFT